MQAFIIRVAAYHGDPTPVGKVYARSGISHDTVIPLQDVVNDPGNEVIIDHNNEDRTSDYDIDTLLADFQDEYGCKVNYGNPQIKDGLNVFEYDVFEPSWPESDEAEDVIADLTRRLVEWVKGYPTGK